MNLLEFLIELDRLRVGGPWRHGGYLLLNVPAGKRLPRRLRRTLARLKPQLMPRVPTLQQWAARCFE